MRQWFQKDLRRLLVDMHINDNFSGALQDFSPENYAEMMRLAGITCAEIYGGNCLGLQFWDTETGLRHQEIGDRDLLKETADACHKRGIDVQLYLNVWCRRVYDLHPEWRVRNADGSGTCDDGSRFGLCCFNSPYGEYFRRMFEEFIGKYECCGYWIDMLGWWGRICYCPDCRRRFREETGREIPEKADWEDSEFLSYARWREKCLTEYAHSLRETLQKTHPERTLTIQSASLPQGSHAGYPAEVTRASDYIAGDFTGDRIQQSAICKLFTAFSACHPMEFMTPRCEDLAFHTTERSLENLKSRARAAAANQASFTLIDAIDPAGTLDRRFYEHAAEVNKIYASYEDYILPHSEAVCDCGIYFSPESSLPEEGESCPHFRAETLRNMVHTLMNEHILFGFTGKFDPDLSRFPVIILSDLRFLSEEECRRLREYVEKGGRLYVSGRTSLYDPVKGRLPDFRLGEVLGIRHTGKETITPSYLSPAGGSFLSGFCTPEYPVMLDVMHGKQQKVTAFSDAEILGTTVLPSCPWNDNEHFTSAISNPPMVRTKDPSLIRHKYGKGKTLYCAGIPEGVPYGFQQKVFASCLRELRGESVVKTDLHPCVEVTLFRQRTEKRLLISLLNLPADLPPLPIFGAELEITLPEDCVPESLRTVPDGSPLSFECEKGKLRFTVDRLEEFLMVEAISKEAKV